MAQQSGSKKNGGRSDNGRSASRSAASRKSSAGAKGVTSSRGSASRSSAAKKKTKDISPAKSLCAAVIAAIALFVALYAAGIIDKDVFPPLGEGLAAFTDQITGSEMNTDRQTTAATTSETASTTTTTTTTATTTTTTTTARTTTTTSTTKATTMTAIVTTTTKTTQPSTAETTDTTTTTAVARENAEYVVNPDYKSPYYIVVYAGESQSVAVYAKGEDGGYNTLAACLTCSTGASSSPTRTGQYKIRAKYRWRALVGNVYGQYSSSISSSYLFHSVPYDKQDNTTLDMDEYAKLGSPASHGCIRLCARDSKWIYDNCPIGTQVNIVKASGPAGAGVPALSDDPACAGWDPSDPDPSNPY